MKFNLITLLVTCCLTIPAAGDHRERYAHAIEHYSHNTADSLKLKAALYLIDNMEEHTSPEGQPLSTFKEKLRFVDTDERSDWYALLWRQCLRSGEITFTPDSALVTSEDLIENIDESFAAWQGAPWRNEVSFDTFCHYILPYRVLDEHYTPSWRKALQERYASIVEGETDVKVAFAKVMKALYKKIQTPNPSGRYSLDVLTYAKIQMADCEQRAVLATCILRSLGIPAVVDAIPSWADYSTKGHLWTAMPLAEDSTYTVYEGESVALRHNRIDASVFKETCDTMFAGQCPYDIMTRKRVSKIYRMEYGRQNPCTESVPVKGMLGNPFISDVSSEYGLRSTLRVRTDTDSTVYLCTYLTGADWMPVAAVRPENGVATFSHIGGGIVCLPMQRTDSVLTPLSAPAYIDGDSVRYIIPDRKNTETIIIDRKYPLCSLFPAKWQRLIGATIEGADDPAFSHPDTLAVITSMPHWITKMKTETKTAGHRYVRFKSAEGKRGLLADLAFVSGTDTLRGDIISYGVYDNYLEKAFDNNPSTYLKVKKDDYWIGYDLGADSTKAVIEIIYTPVTDTNNVEAGHEYRLLYYDGGWHTAGTQRATEGQVTFHGVPKGALLLLKDLTKGREERIFEYNNNRQIWH